MRALVFCLLLLGIALPARAGGDPSDGHSHGEESGGATSVGPTSVTTSVMTRRFEVVLTHAPVRGGQPYAGTLYLADYETNRPVRGATLSVQALGVPGDGFTVTETGEPGVYAVASASGFPRDGRYDVSVSVDAGAQTDLLLLSGLYIGPVESPPTGAREPSGGSGVSWLWVLIVAGLGLALAAFLVRSARHRQATERADPSAPEPSW